ncbi:uncharacterized protein LOC144104152 [Amblyomma americanum]
MTPPFGLAKLSFTFLMVVCPSLRPSAQEIDVAELCAEETISRCYASYLDVLTSAFFLPANENNLTTIDGADDLRACSRLKEMLPCHRRIGHCPKSVLELFTPREESYRYTEDVFCDRIKTNVRTSRGIEEVVARCVDIKELFKCKLKKIQEWKEQNGPDISMSPICNLLHSGKCVESALKNACSIPYMLMKTPFEKAANALAELADCVTTVTTASSVTSGSCQTPLAPVLTVATSSVLCWMSHSF